MPVSYIVYCQRWEESERGWGVRPDGYSLHKSMDDLKNFTDEHWSAMPACVPDEYTRPAGKPYACMVDKKIYDRVQKEINVMSYKNDCPAKL